MTALKTMRKTRIAQIVSFCVCVFLATFAVSLSVGDDARVYMEPNAVLTVGALFLSVLLFRPLLDSSKPAVSPVVVCVALVFALFTVLGMQLDAPEHTLVLRGAVIGSAETSSGLVGCALMVVAFVGFALFYYALVSFAYEKLAAHNERTPPLEQRSTTFLGRRITYLLCIVILLIAWSPYIAYFFPGTVSSDTSRQLAQFFGVNGLSLDTHFPYLTSLVFGGLYQLGTLMDPSGHLGMFLMMLLQVALGAFTFASVVVWLDRLGMKRVVVIGSLIFFALFPLIPAHTVMIEKDTIHAELLVLLTLQIILLFQAKRGVVERSWFFSPVAVGIVALLVALTRNNGIILVVFALVATALLLRNKRLWAVLGCVLVAMSLWQLALVPQLGVASEGPREALSMPAQIVGAHIADELPIAEKDAAVLQDCYDRGLDGLADSYNPLLADSAKNRLSIDSVGQVLEYLGTTARLAIKAPGHALSAALATTYGMWYPFCYGTYHNEDCPYIVTPDNSWASPQWFASYGDLPSMASRTAAGNKLLHALHYLPGLSLLYTPGCYLWLTIFIFGFSLYTKRSRRQTAAALAAFFALALVIVFGPCSSLRYSLPFVFSLPLFVVLLIGCLEAKENASKEAKTRRETSKEVLERRALLIRIAR